MDATSTLALVTSAFTTFGTAVLAILGAALTIGIGYLVFRVGWRKVKGSLR